MENGVLGHPGYGTGDVTIVAASNFLVNADGCAIRSVASALGLRDDGRKGNSAAKRTVGHDRLGRQIGNAMDEQSWKFVATLVMQSLTHLGRPASWGWTVVRQDAGQATGHQLLQIKEIEKT